MNQEQLLEAIEKDHQNQKEVELRYFHSCSAMAEITPILNQQIPTEVKIARMDSIATAHGFSSIRQMHDFRMDFQKNPVLGRENQK